MGSTSLSEMEKRILDQLLISEPKLIAQSLGIKESTVYQHIRNVRRKYVQARKFVNLIDARYRGKGLTKYIYAKEIDVK